MSLAVSQPSGKESPIGSETDSSGGLSKLCQLVFWLERTLHEPDGSPVEWSTLALDEVVRAFSPWVQQLYILRAKGRASEDHPEGIRVARHCMPLYYLLQLPHVLDVALFAVDMVSSAAETPGLDTGLVARVRTTFPTVLEVISFVDRLTSSTKDSIMMQLIEQTSFRLSLSPAAERRTRLQRIVDSTRRVMECAIVQNAVHHPKATSNPFYTLGAAVVKSSLKDRVPDSEEEFWSASEGDEEIDQKTSSANQLATQSVLGCPFALTVQHLQSESQKVEPSLACPVSGITAKQIAPSPDARSKRDGLWECIMSQPQSSCKYPDPKALIQVVQSRDYNSLLNFCGDVYPDGVEKVICSAGGIVAPVSIEWRSQAREHFSGMFRCAEFGLIRLSSVTEPQAPSSWSPYPAVHPMIALKFFRDGDSNSANVVLARQKAGQKEPNVLAHAVSNHFTENVVFPFKAALQFFKKYSEFPTFTGLSEFASICQNGQKADKVIAPYALILFPTETMRVRKVAAGSALIQQVSSLSAGDLLYEIYAIPEPVNSKRLKRPQKGVWSGACIGDCSTPKAVWRVGDMRLTAPFTTSDFGDRKLFFQHHLFEGDLRSRPDWRSKVDTLIGAPEYQSLIENGDLWDPPPSLS